MKYLYSFLSILLLVSCYNVQRNCNTFKTGEFEFYYTIDGIKKKGRFVRTDTLNIDFYEGSIDTSLVRWINNCEFILKKINPKINSEKEPIHIKILSTTSNSYTFEYKLAVKKPNAPIRIEKGEAIKIN